MKNVVAIKEYVRLPIFCFADKSHRLNSPDIQEGKMTICHFGKTPLIEPVREPLFQNHFGKGRQHSFTKPQFTDSSAYIYFIMVSDHGNLAKTANLHTINGGTFSMVKPIENDIIARLKRTEQVGKNNQIFHIIERKKPPDLQVLSKILSKLSATRHSSE